MSGKRKLKELQKAERELNDKLWFQIKKFEKQNGVSIGAESVKRMKKIKKKYGEINLKPCNPFEFGVLCGKFTAIRWAMGLSDLSAREVEPFESDDETE